MITLKEKKMLLKMKTAMGESIDELQAEIQAEESKLQEQSESRKAAFSNIFADLSKNLNELAAQDKKRSTEQQALVEQLGNMFNNIAKDPQVPEEIREELVKVEPVVEPEPSVVDRVVAHVKETTAPSMFVQPDPPTTGRDIQAIQSKLKLLEGWVGKIAMTGPGGGEVLFRYLDDVNRNTMTAANDNWVLEYDAATKKVQFTEDLGPVRTVKMNTTGSIISPTAGMIDWNSAEDCLNVYQADGSVWQQGFEDYIQIHNTTGSTLANGTLVRFDGADDQDVPTVAKYVANGSVKPLYVIGVCTTDVANGAIGRATTRGKARNINTTGSNVGETWARGDLLWAHPTIPGQLTNDQPTSPNIAVSIAAVLRVHATDGLILVRPSIFPRLGNATAHDQLTQTAAAINTPYGVKFRTSDLLDGFTINSSNHSVFTSLQHGLFNIRALLQASSTNSSAANIYVWGRLNGTDIAHTTIRTSIRENGGAAPVTWQYTESFHPGDTFELMWAVDSTSISLVAEAAKSFCPETPSSHININQTDM